MLQQNDVFLVQFVRQRYC